MIELVRDYMYGDILYHKWYYRNIVMREIKRLWQKRFRILNEELYFVLTHKTYHRCNAWRRVFGLKLYDDMYLGAR